MYELRACEPVSDKTSTPVSSIDDSSDSLQIHSEHKLKTEDRFKMVPTVSTVEELAMRMDQGFSRMNEKIEQIRLESKEREEGLCRMIVLINMKKEKLIGDLENNEAAYDQLKQQFDDLQNQYDVLCNEMKTMESNERCLTEENKRLKENVLQLEKEIKDLGDELVSMQPTNHAKGAKYGKLVNQRNVRGKQRTGKSSPKKVLNINKSGK
ncbi:hypothetical protein CHS0354_038479 [Potamilus streckersoni]|uniref:Uncharacterized protein n=1 Tax=Potamilus streckersoni TaxID=2493646 RepID=A0AAE0S6J1_9BIVA|nr:hypothetical protein CHS0354_038479 [Potamilus streckersoni]